MRNERFWRTQPTVKSNLLKRVCIAVSLKFYQCATVFGKLRRRCFRIISVGTSAVRACETIFPGAKRKTALREPRARLFIRLRNRAFTKKGIPTYGGERRTSISENCRCWNEITKMPERPRLLRNLDVTSQAYTFYF